MLTYTTLDGRVLDLSGLTDEERAFFKRCYAAYREGMGWDEFGNLAEGVENPVVRAAGGRVTDIVWKHPLFQAVSDLDDRVGIQQGDLKPDPGKDPETDPLADDWLPTAQAAARKGVTYSGLNQAIKRGAVIARPRPGGVRWLVSLRSLEQWQPMRVRQEAGRQRRGGTDQST